jgi:hypothetical protein
MVNMKEANITNSNVERIGYSIRELSEMSGLSEGFWKKRIKDGDVKAKKFGRRTLVLAKEFNRYLTSLKTAGETEETSETETNLRRAA